MQQSASSGGVCTEVSDLALKSEEMSLGEANALATNNSADPLGNGEQPAELLLLHTDAGDVRVVAQPDVPSFSRIMNY